MTETQKEQQALKVLGLIHDRPGLDGVKLVELYRPTSKYLKILEREGLIIWHDGWYSRGTKQFK